jgi:hypothetical protein
MKKNGIERALEYGKSLTKELSPKIHYLAGYNQAVEDYNSIEADAIQDILSTEIMVLREKNAELVDALKEAKSMIGKLRRSMSVHPECIIGSEFDDYTSNAQNLEDEIESLIKSNKLT